MKVRDQPAALPLFENLPQITLICGPGSVGKRTAVLDLGEHYGNLLTLDSGTVSDVRTLRQALLTAPAGSPERILALLDIHSMPQEAVRALLVMLEEVPASTKVIMTCDGEPPSVISSRASVVRFRTLPESSVREIVSSGSVSPDSARLAALVSGGQVGRALAYLDMSEEKRDVFAVLRAFESHSLSMLDAVARRWDAKRTGLLKVWCLEEMTGRPEVFVGAEFHGMDPKLPLKIMLSIDDQVRPALFIRSTLASLIQGR